MKKQIQNAARKLMDAVSAYDTYRGSMGAVLGAAAEFRTVARVPATVRHGDVCEVAREIVRGA